MRDDGYTALYISFSLYYSIFLRLLMCLIFLIFVLQHRKYSESTLSSPSYLTLFRLSGQHSSPVTSHCIVQISLTYSVSPRENIKERETCFKQGRSSRRVVLALWAGLITVPRRGEEVSKQLSEKRMEGAGRKKLVERTEKRGK